MHKPDLLFNLVNIGLFIGVYYLLRYVQIPLLYNRGKKLFFFLSLILSSIVFILIWRFGMLSLEKIILANCFVANMNLGSYLIEIVQSYTPAVALLAWESFGERKKTIELKNKLEKEKIANELKFLKAQINPQFLINSLNSLHSNVLTKAPDSADMILNLSDILDYVLYKGNKEKSLLSEEVLIVEKFLTLERKRLSPDIQVALDIQGNFLSSISPLSVLSLVENIFKIANFENKISKYGIEISENLNSIICSLTIKPKMANKRDITTIKQSLKEYTRQLDLIYPAAYELDVRIEKETYQILLTLNPNR